MLALVANGAFHPERVKPTIADWDDAPTALLEPATKLVLSRARLAAH
jgi:hypothetical protein